MILLIASIVRTVYPLAKDAGMKYYALLVLMGMNLIKIRANVIRYKIA